MTESEFYFYNGYKCAEEKYKCPHGKWQVLMTEGTARKPIAWKCSICGKKPAYALKTPFCPNCGADLREGDEK